MFIELRIQYTVWKLQRRIKQDAIKGYNTCVISEGESYCPKVIQILGELGYKIKKLTREGCFERYNYYEVDLEDIKLQQPKKFKLSDLFK